MTLSFQIPWYVFVLASLCAAGFSFFTYRSTVPPVSPAKRYLLIALRASALTLLLLAICEPLLRIQRSSVSRPSVAVLTDNTLSMTLIDAAGDREQALRKLLNSAAMAQLASAADLSLYSISPSLHSVTRDSLRLTGATTDIDGALESVRKNKTGELSAILLLSDGNYNLGSNPANSAERSRAPIFTVGIGDSSEQKDLAVGTIVTNTIAYVQSAVPMDVTIKASGFRRRSIPVTLSDESKIIATEMVTLSGADSMGRLSQYSVHFSFVPAEEGVRKYTVRVPALEGEVTARNNAKSVIIRVLKNKMRVLLLAGAPSADVSAVEQALRSDPNIDVSLYVQQSDGTLRRAAGDASFAAALSTAECLAMVGFPVAQTPPSIMRDVQSAATTRALPLFLVLSRTTDYSKLRSLERLLPFTIPEVRALEQTVFASIPHGAQNHLLVETDGSDNASAWNKLPPIFAPLSPFSAKPEALTLATWRIQNVTISTPLILLRNAAQMKSYAVLGYGIYRWKLLAGASTETGAFFNGWISAVVRWLVTRESGNLVQVAPVKELFSRDERVDFTGQVYNESYRPIDNADVRLTVESISGKQRFEAALQPLGGGRYEGGLDMLPEGEYRYTASASNNGANVGTATGRFAVGDLSAEFSDTKMNKPLLQRVAALSGGLYADASSFDQLTRTLLAQPWMKPQTRSSFVEYEVWNLPLLLSIILLLVGIEWLIRKRSGML
jgi:hypothetical protein